MIVQRPCRTCGTPLPEGVKECPQDGTPVEWEASSVEAEDAEWESTVRKDVMVGKQLGEYVVRRRIGSGGMGVVYEGEHPVIGRKVAIKIIRPDSSEGVRSRELIGEARAASAIRHRGIIDIFGFGTLPGVGQYLVMEFLNGRPLDEVILDRAPMPPAEVIRLITEVLGALAAAHAEGVIHRDLKPGNIFIVLESNGSEYVKVLDFGLAKRGAAPNAATPQTRASLIVGTPEYMAPEQACGKPVSPRTDLYAVGIIMFEMLTGRLPFRGDSPMHVAIMQLQAQPPAPSSFVEGLPPELNDLILRMLAKEPEDRPASADAVVRELKSIAKMLAVEMTQLSGFARAVPEPEPVSRSRARGAAAPHATGNRPALTPALGGPTTSRPPPRQGPPARPQPRNAPNTVVPSVTEAELPRTLISGAVASSPVASSPVAPETDVLPVKPRSSPGMRLAAVGVGLAVVLLGAGVGLVMFRDEGDKREPLPVAPATLTVMRPISGTPMEPAPLPKQAPGAEGSQQVDAVPTEAQAQVETPSRTETPPSTQTEAPAQGEASAVQPPDTTASPQKDPVVAVTPRPRPARSRAPGTLQIVAKCWGDVYIDNEFIKRAPVQALPLSAGKHKVELRGNPTIKQPSVTLVIPSGKLLEHTFFCGTSG